MCCNFNLPTKAFSNLNNQETDKSCAGAKPIWVKYVDLHIVHYFHIVVFVIDSNTDI